MNDVRCDLEAVRLRLLDWFARQLPEARAIVVSPLKRPGAGISNETYFFDLQWQQDGHAVTKNLVMRWPPQGFKVFPASAYDMGKQFRLLQALAKTAVPVPPAQWLEEDASVLGAPFYIMEKVEGWVPSDFPPYHVEGPLFEASQTDRLQTWWNAIDTIAQIHMLDWKAAGLGFLSEPAAGTDFMRQQIASFDAVFALNQEPMPAVLAHTRDWLLQYCPTPKHIGLCWGDARLGNMLLRGTGVAAVLDWEMACLGDPESDLGWFAHIDWATSVGRSKNPFPRMAGLPTMAQSIAHYEQRTGRKVENLHYYEVFATWRLAILFTRMEQDQNYISRSGNAKGFLTGTHYGKLKALLNII
ncbi:MAG: phosphotransferase family protein [Rhodoferax sp.]|nr:phosphotransferase family protein [Rhodoferax sp.]